MSDDARGVAVFWSVGPGELEIARTRDLVEGLRRFEPEVRWCVVIDDSPHPRRELRELPAPDGAEMVVLPNPRNGRGIGVMGGLAVGVLTALQWIARHTDAAFALKLDTDSLVIGPFADAIRAAFDRRPDVGILGSFLRNPNGEIREPLYWRRFARRLAALVRVTPGTRPWRPSVTQALWGERAHIRAILSRARRNGYEFGDHCQGGGYALSPVLIRRLHEAGYLDDPLLWLRTECSEDVMMGILAHACGMGLLDLNGDGEPFGVQYKGLPDTPERLLARGFSIVHSTKNDVRRTEPEIRAFFRAHRSAAIGSVLDA